MGGAGDQQQAGREAAKELLGRHQGEQKTHRAQQIEDEGRCQQDNFHRSYLKVEVLQTVGFSQGCAQQAVELINFPVAEIVEQGRIDEAVKTVPAFLA